MDADQLLADAALEASPVVANNAMNRLRGLRGANSYAKELGFDPVERLRARSSVPSWLDLCCGSGRALAEAAAAFGDRDVTLVGVDLVEFFTPAPPGRPLLVADLDLAEVVTGDPGALRRDLRAAGFEYDARRRRIIRRGPGTASLPYRYLGADDRAGAGYTGQPSVRSHYARESG
ncbi:SAM-dependent methyltransferase [Catenuloplanes indicus]|uniref:SAM-dependent methyltransferase n=1 Tax=Catenuloplanes indicus TaxID=137267 RepID=A0AAE3W660_9ACTN|nr:SAM-dependent methyltransferase [Catenuloplanes indicus]MDQ0370224.1 SAM-dependent methyltransferase [Catenuloplanes indicus]